MALTAPKVNCFNEKLKPQNMHQFLSPKLFGKDVGNGTKDKQGSKLMTRTHVVVLKVSA